MVDFSREDFKPLMEHEVNGLDYRYVNSDKARLSVVVQGIENGSASLLDAKGELHAYYHTDYLGTTDYLTSAVNSKVISWTSYSEWGEITHNAVLKCGQRELDLVKEYATHDFDAVLNMYYAKARFYDADNRRFAEIDPILDPSQYDLRQYVKEPMALGQYLYANNNAIIFIDPLGMAYILHVLSSEYPYKELGSGVVNDMRYAGSRYYAVREVQDIINRIPGFSSNTLYSKEKNQVYFRVGRDGNNFAFEFDVDDVKNLGGRPFLLTSKGKNGDSYFRFYNCVIPGGDKTYVNVNDISTLLDVIIILENNEAKMQYSDSGHTYIIGDSTLASLGFYFSKSEGIAIDNTSVGWVETVSTGFQGTFGVSKGIFIARYNTGDMMKISGDSVEIGGSVPFNIFGLTVNLGLDHSFSVETEGGVSGNIVTASMGISPTLVYEGHFQHSITKVTNDKNEVIIKAALAVLGIINNGPVSISSPVQSILSI